MARIRTIKPEFFTSEDVVSLTPLARLLYIAMWCESDRMGRFEWKPRTFKLRYLPGDNCDVETLATELTDSGMVCLYEVDGRMYAEIPSFTRHQSINNREADSEIPARVPTRQHASSTREPRVQAEGKEGREGKGKEHASGDAVRPADPLDGIDPRVVKDFRELRSRKKAPITETAIAGIKREAERAGMTLEQALRTCCERGWTGFKADWVQRDGGQQQPSNDPGRLPRLVA
jgi:hypothetical protein